MKDLNNSPITSPKKFNNINVEIMRVTKIYSAIDLIINTLTKTI